MVLPFSIGGRSTGLLPYKLNLLQYGKRDRQMRARDLIGGSHLPVLFAHSRLTSCPQTVGRSISR